MYKITFWFYVIFICMELTNVLQCCQMLMQILCILFHRGKNINNIHNVSLFSYLHECIVIISSQFFVLFKICFVVILHVKWNWSHVFRNKITMIDRYITTPVLESLTWCFIISFRSLKCNEYKEIALTEIITGKWAKNIALQ